MQTTLNSIEKGMTLYYTKVTDAKSIHVVHVDDVTDTHYLIRFSKQLVYDVKKHKRSITNYYHTLDAAQKACEEKIKIDHEDSLRILESNHVTNLLDAGSNLIYWFETSKKSE